MHIRCAEKSRRSAGSGRPVPQTDTGGWVEQTKVRERNHVKELGKIASYLREKRRLRRKSNRPGASRS